MEAEAGHESLFANPHLWVNIGLIVFLVVAGPKLWKALTSLLDQRSIRIKAQLDEAQKLRDEAQALLNEYQRRQKDAAQEADGIIAAAKELAQHHTQEAMAALEASMARREKLALEKIAQAEAQAAAEVRREAVEVATAATRKLIAQALTDDRAVALVDQSIKELDRKLH
ncbi:MAG TPA: F0F1 ATP synthase subunit B [Candidatus Binatia bacterium]|nr:F0F1 ATP synthase subunit B [Candidatus Binatia bacterium]